MSHKAEKSTAVRSGVEVLEGIDLAHFQCNLVVPGRDAYSVAGGVLRSSGCIVGMPNKETLFYAQESWFASAAPSAMRTHKKYVIELSGGLPTSPLGHVLNVQAILSITARCYLFGHD